MILSCSHKPAENPFITGFQTEYGVPPFEQIDFSQYQAAFNAGIAEQNELINAIMNNPEAPTFDNTIVALDNSSPILDRVSMVFYSLADAETTDEITELAMNMAPILAEQSDNIMLNKPLFDRIKAVYQEQGSMNLTTEQKRLLDETYKSFVRSGANLDEKQQGRLREINKELSTLEIAYSNNLLNENNEYQLFIQDKTQLSGLPEWFVQSAAEESTAAGKPGQWLFTLHNSSRLPLLQYADNRDLRREIYLAYINKGNMDNANNNKEIITKIVQLRLEKANLMGYHTYADFVLDNTMDKTPVAVIDLLTNLWGYALPKPQPE